MLKKICFAALFLSLLFCSSALADYPLDMWDYDYTSYEEAYNDGFKEGYQEAYREMASDIEEAENLENENNQLNKTISELERSYSQAAYLAVILGVIALGLGIGAYATYKQYN